MAEKKFVSDDQYSEVDQPVEPVGGKAKQSQTGADLKTEVDPEAEKIVQKADGTAEKKDELGESFLDLFEGADLSEDFKDRATLIFEAAVTEAVAQRSEDIVATMTEEFNTKLEEAVQEQVTVLQEGLDAYMDLITKEWLEENKLAVESSVKVEMAESLMEGLKNLFEEHNIDISEETVDVVRELEEETEALRAEANKRINEAVELRHDLQVLRAEKVFAEVAEGLTVGQAERLRTLSENLKVSDLDAYAKSISTLKESFFKKEKLVVEARKDTLDELEDPALVESTETRPAPKSHHEDVNAIAGILRGTRNQKY
ncbi:MAG: hypothetical protein WCY93_11405 [Anaerolineaceae bacterium]